MWAFLLQKTPQFLNRISESKKGKEEPLHLESGSVIFRSQSVYMREHCIGLSVMLYVCVNTYILYVYMYFTKIIYNFNTLTKLLANFKT